MWGGPGVVGIPDLRAYHRAHRVDYLGIWRTRHGIGQLGNRASFGWNASSWAKIGNPPTHTEGMTVSAGQPWQHAAAVCGDADCGSMVEFQPTTIPSWQGTIRRFDAACPVDPAHPLGDQARRMLDQVRRQNS